MYQASKQDPIYQWRRCCAQLVSPIPHRRGRDHGPQRQTPSANCSSDWHCRRRIAICTSHGRLCRSRPSRLSSATALHVSIPHSCFFTATLPTHQRPQGLPQIATNAASCPKERKNVTHLVSPTARSLAIASILYTTPCPCASPHRPACTAHLALVGPEAGVRRPLAAAEAHALTAPCAACVAVVRPHAAPVGRRRGGGWSEAWGRRLRGCL